MANNKFTLMLEGSFTFAMKDGQPVVGGTPHPVKLTGNSAEVDGIAYAIEAVGLEESKGPSKSRKATAGAAEAAGAVTAIMPGLIIKILKQEGERVEVGDTILILEAMKMQNDIQAKVAGTIQQLNVKQGDNVEMRQVLCIIE